MHTHKCMHAHTPCQHKSTWKHACMQPCHMHNGAVVNSPFWLFLDFVFFVVFSLTEGHFSALTRTSQGSRKLLLWRRPGWSKPYNTVRLIGDSPLQITGVWVGWLWQSQCDMLTMRYCCRWSMKEHLHADDRVDMWCRWQSGHVTPMT